MLLDYSPSLIRSLDPEQQRSLAIQKLSTVLSSSRATAKMLLETTEMLLLVLLRHVEYYSDSRHMGAPVKATVGNAMRLLATSEPAVFQGEMSGKIGALLGKLESLDLVSWIYFSVELS